MPFLPIFRQALKRNKIDNEVRLCRTTNFPRNAKNRQHVLYLEAMSWLIIVGVEAFIFFLQYLICDVNFILFGEMLPAFFLQPLLIQFLFFCEFSALNISIRHNIRNILNENDIIVYWNKCIRWNISINLLLNVENT